MNQSVVTPLTEVTVLCLIESIKGCGPKSWSSHHTYNQPKHTIEVG